MRSVRRASSDVAASIDKYLLPREVRVATVRQHAALLVPPVAAAIGGLLAAVAVTIVSGGARPLEAVAWLLEFFLIARFIAAVLSWLVLYITVTDVRVVLTSGLFSRKIKMIPLPNFAEMTFERSFSGRISGYGRFIVEATGKPYLIIDYMPYSEQMWLMLSGRIRSDSARFDWEDLDAEPSLAGDDGELDSKPQPSESREPSHVPDNGGEAASEHPEPTAPDDSARAHPPPDQSGPGDRPGALPSGPTSDDGPGPDGAESLKKMT